MKNIELSNEITELGEYQFAGFTSLQSIIIPKSIISIGENAFESCDNLTIVYYLGNMKEWNEVSNINAINDATVYFYSEYEPTLEGNYWDLDLNGYPAIWD